MVSIPTTQRQFFNTQPKVNSVGVVTSSLLPAVKQYKQERFNQQKVKIDTESTKARIEIDNKVNQWQLKNQARPDDPEAKSRLKSDIQEILTKYGNEIDPVAKMEWDITANKLSSAYELGINNWARNQRAENAKLDVAENMNLNLIRAYKNGGKNDALAALSDLELTYNQILDYASPSMGETEARKLLKEYKGNYVSAFLLGTNKENPYLAQKYLGEEQIRNALGSPEKLVKIEGLIGNSIKKIEREQAVVNRFDNPGSVYDPKNNDDKKEVDYLYSLETNNNQLSDDNRLSIGLDIAGRTGILPKDTRRYIRGYLRSGTPEQAVTAAAAIMQLKNYNPQILNDLSAQDISLGNMINVNIERGYNPDTAYKKAIEAINVQESVRKTREAEYIESVQKKNKNENFLEEYFETAPWLSLNYEIPPEMLNEFNAAVRNEYIITGDLESAQNTAAANMSKLWGKSRFNNSKSLMRQAPEKVYGVSGLDDDENFEWMHNQLLSEINANRLALKKYEPEQIKIYPSLQTRNGKVVYDIFIKDDNGVVNMLPEKWQPVWEKTKEAERQKKYQQKDIETQKMRRRMFHGDMEAFKQYFSEDDTEFENLNGFLETIGSGLVASNKFGR